MNQKLKRFCEKGGFHVRQSCAALTHTACKLQVTCANDGQEAVDLVRARLGTPRQFDLCLFDLNMSASFSHATVLSVLIPNRPRKNGDEATRELRAAKVTTPILAVSGKRLQTLEFRSSCNPQPTC